MTVAEFPIWLAIPPRIPHRTAVFKTDERTFLAAPYFDCVVEWHANGSSTNLLTGRRFQGEHVC